MFLRLIHIAASASSLFFFIDNVFHMDIPPFVYPFILFKDTSLFGWCNYKQGSDEHSSPGLHVGVCPQFSSMNF